MRKAAALVTLTIAAVGWAGTPAAWGSATHVRHRAAAARARTTHAASGPGTQLWAARYNGPGNNLSNDDAACCAAVSPNGKLVFVTGYSNGRYSVNYATIAYNAATGARVWLKRYSRPNNMGDSASSLAVSPNGDTVYVTGYSTGKISGQDYLTIAYNATTGATRWLRSYNGPGNGMDTANSVVVSPSGGMVYVTGGSMASATESDYATIAYNAATGAQRWVSRYRGPGNGGAPTSVAVSPSGDTVFVTGSSTGKTSEAAYATVAYNAATGAQRWVKRYKGPGSGLDQATSMAVSPAGDAVFVTGYTVRANNADEFTTIAYNATTGATRWLRSYDGPDNGPDIATKVAISPSGSTVFVTGWCYTKVSRDYATIAYNAATGARMWLKRLASAALIPSGLAVGRGGSNIYVTGDSSTVGYNAATGARLWVKRYDGSATSAAVSPVTGTVYVTGESIGPSRSEDYLTIAYHG